MTKYRNCFLCGETLDKTREVLSIDGFRILTDIAPLTEGHLLIAPPCHIRSLSKLTKDQLTIVVFLKNLCKIIIKEIYKKNIIFLEHGMSSNCSVSACGIEHAHLHVVPVESNEIIFGISYTQFLIKNIPNLSQPSISILKDYADILCVHSSQKYLFTEDVNGKKTILLSDSHFPSQILRKYLCCHLEMELEYDWQIFYDEEKSYFSAQYLSCIFREKILKLFNKNLIQSEILESPKLSRRLSILSKCE
jgi:diadenosine tetraphosphate (Ap4A) HIT family hydrolase